MNIHEIVVIPQNPKDDNLGHEVSDEAERSLGIPFDEVRTAKVYRVEGVSGSDARRLMDELLVDPVTEVGVVRSQDTVSTAVEVAYKPGVMNPEAGSIMKAAKDKGIYPVAADSSREYSFFGVPTPEQIRETTHRLLVNDTVQTVVTKKVDSLVFSGEAGPINVVPIRQASETDLDALSRDKLFLNREEMTAIQQHFRGLERDPKDAELETIAAWWSEHCGHKTFKAKVMVRQEDGTYIEKSPLIDRIMNAAKAHPNYDRLVVSAFDDNSGVMRFYDGWAINGKVETHNSPSALEPYGGAMTGSGGVFRDIMGTGQGAKTVISTDMFCFAPPDIDEAKLPPGTLHPDYLQRRVIQGVRDYGNRMGIPTGNGSVHYHEDFRAKPAVVVGAYGILPEARAEKGQPEVGDLVVAIGGRTGRDGIHGATFSSGEMTDRTATVNSNAVQIGNAIEQKRMADALLEARDAGLIRAITDCGAAGFCSAIGEIGEHTGITIDLSRAPLKYEGLSPWEIWVSESQERMVAAVAPEDAEAFQAICQKYNVEATVLGDFDGSGTLTVNYAGQNAIELDYDFLKNGLPERVMYADWQPPEIPEIRPYNPGSQSDVWVHRLKAVLAHGNVSSKEPITRQYDQGVQGGNIVPPFGGIRQEGPNDALVIRPLLDKPYGMVQSHGLNPILVRLDPYEGTKWAIAEAAANYVAVGGDINEAVAVGNYIWPAPDEESMGSLDLAVDGAVDMMKAGVPPVISGKDSLSATYRGQDGEVIKIPPVYDKSIFGRIPDVEKTITSDIKKPGSTLVLVGALSEGMGGSTYYDIAGGSSRFVPKINPDGLVSVLTTMQEAIAGGQVLACHDVSEGGVATTIAEMCFGGGYGADITVPEQNQGFEERFLFNETAGCFVAEVDSLEAADALFGNVPHTVLGSTSQNQLLTVRNKGLGQDPQLFSAPTQVLKAAWQQPLKAEFPS